MEAKAINLLDGISSPNIIQVIKLKSIRWAGHMACVGRVEMPAGSSSSSSSLGPVS
jgi:hypothetical protein